MYCRWLWMATLKDCECFREGWLLKHLTGRLFHSGVGPAANARRRLSRDLGWTSRLSWYGCDCWWRVRDRVAGITRVLAVSSTGRTECSGDVTSRQRGLKNVGLGCHITTVWKARQAVLGANDMECKALHSVQETQSGRRCTHPHQGAVLQYWVDKGLVDGSSAMCRE